MKMKTVPSLRQMTAAALMSVVMMLCSMITVPSVVPFTLQTFGVALAVGLLGKKSGLLSVVVYLLLGLAGLPVFAGMQGGAGVLFGPTGGYLIGFLPMVLLSGWLMKNKTKLWQRYLALVVGLLADYAIGTLWYVLVYAGSAGGIAPALVLCVLPYLLPDALKLLGAVLIIQKLKPYVRVEQWTY